MFIQKREFEYVVCEMPHIFVGLNVLMLIFMLPHYAQSTLWDINANFISR